MRYIKSKEHNHLTRFVSVMFRSKGMSIGTVTSVLSRSCCCAWECSEFGSIPSFSIAQNICTNPQFFVNFKRVCELPVSLRNMQMVPNSHFIPLLEERSACTALGISIPFCFMLQPFNPLANSHISGYRIDSLVRICLP